MISRNRVHSEVLKVINETCVGMTPMARTRLSVEIAKGLHPVLVEQIQREIDAAAEVADPIGRGRAVGGYPSSSRQVADLAVPPSGPAPGGQR